MPRVIVNSTPLIVLSNIGQLDLLRKLYSEIFVPQSVFDEVTAKDDSACQQIRNLAEWIHVCRIQNQDAKRMYQAKLHAGEVEVMILAQETPVADLVILDDNAVRAVEYRMWIHAQGLVPDDLALVSVQHIAQCTAGHIILGHLFGLGTAQGISIVENNVVALAGQIIAVGGSYGERCRCPAVRK